ncbi:MAG TPA: DUF5317 family protein [Anaerovoracaceae bacterium]|nr:DUF5317 family protein [Anaerovoracaceae bacterium]
MPDRLYLPILAFAAEFIFSKGPFPEWVVIPFVYILVFWFVISNLKGRGSWPYFIGVGTLLNFIVISLNDFKMPVWPSLLKGGGKVEILGTIVNGEFFGYVPVGPSTKLAFLADVIGISFQGELIGLASFGDILLLIGAIILVCRMFKASSK